jgi:hypothetical protein
VDLKVDPAPKAGLAWALGPRAELALEHHLEIECTTKEADWW